MDRKTVKNGSMFNVQSSVRDAIIAAAKGPVIEREPGVFVKSYSFSSDFIGFSGHFTGYPILPAFVQLLTVLMTAEEAKGRPLKLVSVEKAKFQMEIYPDREIEVEYRDVVAKGRAGLKATLTAAEDISASLLLTFEETG